MFFSKASSQFLPLKGNVLGAVARCQVLNKSHSLFWIPSIEVPFTSCVQSHLICHRDAFEESAEQLHFIEYMAWTIPLIRLESDPRGSERLCRLLCECSSLAPQVRSTCLIKEITQECVLDVSPGCKRSWW